MGLDLRITQGNFLTRAIQTTFLFLEHAGSCRGKLLTLFPDRYVAGITSLDFKFGLDGILRPYSAVKASLDFPFSRPNEHLKALMNHHMQASFSNPQILSWSVFRLAPRGFHHMGFHIVAYMTLEVLDKRVPEYGYNKATYLNKEAWPGGHLYDEETKIVQVSYSVYYSRKFWNMDTREN